MQVKNYEQLQEALLSDEKEIEIINSITIPNSIVLKEGKKLIGNNDEIFLSFINGDGIALTGDNEISNISIQTSPNRRAIYIDSTLKDLKNIVLRDLTVTGMIQLLTRKSNNSLNIDINNIDIVSADSRNYPEKPMKYGVIVHQGALTIYNYNPSEDSIINVRAENISIGRKHAPVIGSGIFISGFNDDSGKVNVEKLTTNAIYSNGMIPSGQPNLITGAIFIVYGANAKEIISNGPVVTYGTNDMVLDVWGTVENWIVKDSVISYGASGIGFVNFGYVKDFRAEKYIETYGLGARGFNQYDGRIDNASFKGIKTEGDGSIGMQFSKPVGKITIEENVKTNGATGETLVKGEIQTLKADALSVIEGGSIEEFTVGGNIITNGEDCIGYHINGGSVEKLNIKGEIIVNKEKSKEVLIENGGESSLNTIEKYL